MQVVLILATRLQEVASQEAAGLGCAWAGPKGRGSGSSAAAGRRSEPRALPLRVLGRLLPVLKRARRHGFASSGNVGRPGASARSAGERPTPPEPPPEAKWERRGR